MTRRPLNYTTTIAAAKTVAECHQLLAEAGADAVATTYTARAPSGLSFRLSTPAGIRDFALPVNIDGVYQLLMTVDLGGRNRALRTGEQAARVAWRIAKDWLEAQLAIIDAGMATLDEIMLPWMQIDGRNAYAVLTERALALEAGE